MGLAAALVIADAESAARCLVTLTIPELTQIARSVGVSKVGLKSDVVARLAECIPAHDKVSALDTYVELTSRPTFDTARIAFFGNRRQDLTEFVLVDLERLQYPEYTIDRAEPLFPTRASLDEYVAAASAAEIEVSTLADEELEAVCRATAELVRATPTVEPFRRRIDPGRYHARLLLASARELERRGRVDAATASYEIAAVSCADVRAGVEAATRLAILARRERTVELFDTTSRRILDRSDVDEIARYSLALRRHRLGLCESPDANLHPTPEFHLTLAAAGHSGSKAQYRGTDGERISVEEGVRRAFGESGLHAENALYCTLFGILLWDEIFAPMPGAFLHPFQTGPLDLGSSSFYASRKEMIDERFACLEACDLEREIHHCASRNRGRLSRFIQWDGYSLDDLVRAANGLGGSLVPILARIARHPGRHARGLPDLLVWEDGRAVAVEVKGPGDVVQLEQRLWHDAMIRAGLDVRIARVRRSEQ